MIRYSNFSYFDAFDDIKIQTIVNTINCVGVMGKGLALEFKIHYPDMYADYIERWENKSLKIGRPYLFKTDSKWILNFPTKDHWRLPSKMEYIEKGLIDFSKNYRDYKIQSIAFPRLGCTSGGLRWDNVKKLMEKYLSQLKDIDIYVFLDNEASDSEKSLIGIINSSSKEKIKRMLGISERQYKIILDHINTKGHLKRVRDLLSIKGVGVKTYQKIIEKRTNLNVSEQLRFTF